MKKSKKASKKAILFTLISILLAALFFAMFSYDSTVSVDEKIPSTNIRVKVIDTYVRNFETYAENSIAISSYRTLESLNNYAISTDFFADYDSFNQTFSNCMACGHTSCALETIDCPAPLYEDVGGKIIHYDLYSMLNKVNKTAEQEMNIKTKFVINSVTIKQNYLPFEVDVIVDLSYDISDDLSDKSLAYATWSVRKNITKAVSIIGLTDPTASINTRANPLPLGVYIKPIKRTSICEFSDVCWNANTSKEFYDSQEFRYSKNGTNYLERFWNGNQKSYCCGLESFVNVSYATGYNSHIDNIYWKGNYICPSPGASKILKIDAIAPDFMLDEENRGYYAKDTGDTVCSP